MVRVSRNNAIPEIVLTIPPIINRIEELPVGESPPFDSIGAKVGDGKRVGFTITAVGEGNSVGVKIDIGVGDIGVSAANTVNDCITVVNMPPESRVLIIIV